MKNVPLWALLGIGGGLLAAYAASRRHPLVWGAPFRGIDMLCLIGAQHEED